MEIKISFRRIALQFENCTAGRSQGEERLGRVCLVIVS